MRSWSAAALSGLPVGAGAFTSREEWGAFCNLVTRAAREAGHRMPRLVALSEVQVSWAGAAVVDFRARGWRLLNDDGLVAFKELPDGEERRLEHFEEWSTEPPPEWAPDGGPPPGAAGQCFAAARVEPAEAVLHATDERSGRWWTYHLRPAAAWAALRHYTRPGIDQPEELQELVRFVLEHFAAEEEERGAASWALTDAAALFRAAQVRDLRTWCQKLRKAARMDSDQPPQDEAGAQVLADVVSLFNGLNPQAARDLAAAGAADAWSIWAAKPDSWFVEDGQRRQAADAWSMVLRRLGAALWLRREPEAAANARNGPALTRGVLRGEVVELMTTAQKWLPGMEEREVKDRRGRIVATIDAAAADLALVHEGLAALRAPVGHRLVKSLVLTAHAQAAAGDTDARVVAFAGWSALAEALKWTNRDYSTLKALALAGASVAWHERGGTHGGGWWSYEAERQGRRFKVSFSLSPRLLPKHGAELAHDAGSSIEAREARRLIPELRYEPPIGGLNERSHGAAWNLHRLFLVELVDKAEELAQDGAVVIPERRWLELANLAGLPEVHLGRLLASWHEGESEEAPALVESSDRAYRLAERPHSPEHDFIVDGGKMRIQGRRGGRLRRKTGRPK
jgi:hypothetical protein